MLATTIFTTFSMYQWCLTLSTLVQDSQKVKVKQKVKSKTKNKPFFGEGNGCEGTQHDSVNDQEPVIGRTGKEVSAL